MALVRPPCIADLQQTYQDATGLISVLERTLAVSVLTSCLFTGRHAARRFSSAFPRLAKTKPGGCLVLSSDSAAVRLLTVVPRRQDAGLLATVPDDAWANILRRLDVKDLASLAACSKGAKAVVDRQHERTWQAAAAQDPGAAAAASQLQLSWMRDSS